MEKTEKLGLKKPNLADFFNIADFNENSERIDQFAKQTETHINLRAQIAYGTYVGTGLGTASLTFEFAPAFVLITSTLKVPSNGTSDGYEGNFAMFFPKTGLYFGVSSQANAYDNFYSIEGTLSDTAVSWESSQGDVYPKSLNAAGAIYHYIAIG